MEKKKGGTDNFKHRDTDSLRKWEKEFKESNELQRLLANQSIVGMHILQDGYVKYANHATALITGYSIEEMLNWEPEGYHILLHPDEMLYVMEQARRKQAGNPDVVVNYTSRIISKSGEMKWVESFSRTITFEGAPADFVIIVDITERKLVEEKLSKSEKIFSSIFHLNSDLMVISDLETGEIIDVNQSYINWTGYAREEIIGVAGETLHLWVNPDDRGEIIGKLRVEGEVNGEEILARQRNGSIRDMLVSARFVEIEQQFYFLMSGNDITDRKQAEEVLRESESKYRSLFDNSIDAVLLTEPDGGVVAANPAACLMFGCTEDDICRVGRKGLMDPSDARWEAAIEERLRTGRFHGELTCLRKDGSSFDCEISSTIFNDRNGKPKTSMILRDVTMRKQIEEALRKSELTFRSLFEASPIGIFTVIGRKFVQVNPAMCKVMGYSVKEFIGQSVRMAYRDDEEYERAGKMLYGGITREGVGFMEARLRCRNGEEFDALIWLNPIDPQTPSLGYEGIMMDITERRQAERKLQENEERLRGITRNLPGFIFQFCVKDNGQYIINYAGGRLVDFMGLEPDKDVLFSAFFSHVHEKDKNKFLASVKKAVEKKSPWNNEFRVVSPSGKITWFQGTSTPMHHEDKLVFTGILLDITERKKAEEEIGRTQDQMRAFAARLQTIREEERSRIAREIHDELGGALTAIKIDCSLLKRAAAEIKEKSLKDHLSDQIQSTTKFIDKSIKTVRKISTELRPGILDDLGIMAALEWQLNDFQRRTGIQCRWVSALRKIRLNEQETTALFRIFQETLVNVTRHAGADEVRVRLRREANAYILEVEDNGKGITEKNVNDKRSLGLLGMRERALAVGGRIDIKGRRGKGTKVTVEIPIKQTGKNRKTKEGSTP